MSRKTRTTRLTVAEYLTKAMDLSGKTQREIAREVGYDKPNVVSMMKMGQTKVPIEKAPLFARACGVDPVVFLRLVLEEYHRPAWEVIRDTVGEPLSENERELLAIYRKAAPTDEIEITAKRREGILEALGASPGNVASGKGGAGRTKARRHE